MKKYLFLFIFSLQITTLSFGAVQICQRDASILAGMVQHKWFVTDTVSAGMGSQLSLSEDEQIGDVFEAPYLTKVYVVDHSNQVADSCRTIEYVDEDCINSKLVIGKSLGRFKPLNNCQTFIRNVINQCQTSERIAAKKTYYRLKAKQRHPKRPDLSLSEIQLLEEYKEKFDF